MIKTKLVIAICSHRESKLRNLCKNGWIDLWGNHPDIQWFFYVGNDFVPGVGIPGAVTLDCYDDYDRLPGKTKAMCNYALTHYDFTWLYKCDDDTWLNPNRLLDQLDTLYQDADYIGDDHGYRCNLYYKNNMHPYGHGGSGYVLSKRSARIAGSTIHHEQLGCEDLVLGLVLQKQSISLVDEPRLQHYYKPQLVPSPSNEMISTHGVTTPEQVTYIMSKWI